MRHIARLRPVGDCKFVLALSLVLLLALCPSPSQAELLYEYGGKTESIPLVQLWYEGHWQAYPPMNGTITWQDKGDLRGKIFVGPGTMPLEPILRKLQTAGVAAAVFYSIGAFAPGFTMYFVDGKNRSDVWLPTFETVFDSSTKHFLKIAEGSTVQCIPTENTHKKANDTKFQLVLNLVQSFLELAILAIVAVRLYQFYAVAQLPFLSIAPLCCIFESIGAALRLAYTVVDPFFTYRILPFNVSLVFTTISWPFSEAAGILLTFFWAETLSKANIQALPFISRYKWSAIGSVVFLFTLEIVLSCVRAIFPRADPPIYVSSAVALIIQVTLIVCYLSSAIAIMRRVGSRRSKALVRKMTLRISVSCLGYVICIISIICFALLYQQTWGRATTFNTNYLGWNIAGLMQVLALKPPSQNRRTTSSTVEVASTQSRAGKEEHFTESSDDELDELDE